MARHFQSVAELESFVYQGSIITKKMSDPVKIDGFLTSIKIKLQQRKLPAMIITAF